MVKMITMTSSLRTSKYVWASQDMTPGRPLSLSRPVFSFALCTDFPLPKGGSITPQLSQGFISNTSKVVSTEAMKVCSMEALGLATGDENTWGKKETYKKDIYENLNV